MQPERCKSNHLSDDAPDSLILKKGLLIYFVLIAFKERGCLYNDVQLLKLIAIIIPLLLGDSKNSKKRKRVYNVELLFS